MSDERLKPVAITPMKQSFEMGCGPTSVAMVLSGFGIKSTEQVLAEGYFPNTLLPFIDPTSGKINHHSGLDNQHLVEGMVRILEDLGLQNQLRVDVFDSWLWKYTTSKQERYIVEATPEAIRKNGDRFKEDDSNSKMIRGFYQTLEALVKNRRIGVYTANARTMQLDQMSHMFRLSNDNENGFYNELADWVRKGHIVGPHGGMTAHIRALDGSRTERIPWTTDEEGFVMFDPRGESYVIRLSSLVIVDTLGVRGDVFDYLFRISPQEAVLNPYGYDIRSFLHSLRQLLQ